jgi:hypothetical protein
MKMGLVDMLKVIDAFAAPEDEFRKKTLSGALGNKCACSNSIFRCLILRFFSSQCISITAHSASHHRAVFLRTVLLFATGELHLMYQACS